MATIQEQETKKQNWSSRIENKGRRAPRRQPRKADESHRISQPKSGQNIHIRDPDRFMAQKCTEEMKEEWYAEKEDIFKNQPKGRAKKH